MEMTNADAEWIVFDRLAEPYCADNADAVLQGRRVVAIRRSVLAAHGGGVSTADLVAQHRCLQVGGPVPTAPSLATRAAQAAVAIAQNAVGANQRSADEIKRITDICGACADRKQLVTAWCKACGCMLSQKIRNAGTECPVGKWGKSEA